MAMLVRLGLVTASEAAKLKNDQVDTLVDEVQFELVQHALGDPKIQAQLKHNLDASVKSVTKP